MWTFAIFILAAFNQLEAATFSGCSFNIKPDFRHQWPLIFKTNGELFPTRVIETADVDQLVVETPANGELLLSCGPNYFKKFERDSVLQVKCNKLDNNFEIVSPNNLHKGDKKHINDLTCDLRVIEEVLTTVDGCSNSKLTATNFGYVEPIQKETRILGEACYDETEGRTLFARVRLGSNKDSNILRVAENNFLTRQKHPNGRYKIELFRGLFFDEIMERLRTTLKIPISEVPELNMASFIDESLLSSSQFQAVKKLGWNYFLANGELQILKELKENIRELSATQNINVWIGSHGVKTFFGENDKQFKLYLHNGSKNRFPMPEYIWLLVQDLEQSKIIGFVVANTELSRAALLQRTGSSTLCRSQCEKLTWLNENLKKANIANNFLSCCSYEDLKKSIDDLPEINVKSNNMLL